MLIAEHIGLKFGKRQIRLWNLLWAEWNFVEPARFATRPSFHL